MSRLVIAAALALAAVLPAIPAQATSLTRTFVSSAGSDSNACTITQPCATFARAYSLTAASGIIAALDPGKYGPLTITGPITINGYGWAAITGPANGDAITINAVSGTVALTGLEIDGAGTANNGIVFNSGASLTVNASVIRNFAINAITLNAPAPVSIFDTLVSDNTSYGIVFQPSAAATLTLERVQAIGNSGIGLLIEGDNAASGAVVASTCADCVISGNGDGFFNEGFSNTAQPTSTIVNCKIVNNNIGLVSSESTVNLAQSTISINKMDGFVVQLGGSIKSFGNNFITDTTNQGTFTSIAQR